VSWSARDTRQQAHDLFGRYRQGGDPGLLRAAAERFEAAAAAAANGDPQRSKDLDHACIVLRVYFDETKELWAVDRAIAVGRAAVAAAPDAVAAVPPATHLGIALHSRYQLTHERQPLREAVAVLRRAAVDCPLSSELRPSILHHLAIALVLAFEDSDETSLLAEAVDTGRAASQLRGPLVLATAADLTRSLGTLAYRTGDVRLNREAVATARWALPLAAREGPHQEAVMLLALARALQSLSWATGDPEPLREAIQRGEAATAREPDPVLQHLNAMVTEGFVAAHRRLAQ
jgi:hypothetical protein